MSDYYDTQYLDEFLDDQLFEEDYDEELDEDEFDEDIARYVRQKKVEGVHRLRSQDYSLNSPLISDDLEALVDGLHRGSTHGALLSLRSRMLRSCGVKPRDIKHPEKIHPWIGKFFQQPLAPREMLEINELLKRTYEDHIVTSQVLRAFLHSWTQERYSPIDLTVVDPSIRHWGQKFFDFHKMVMILNASCSAELRSLSTTWNSEIHELSGTQVKSKTADGKQRVYSILPTRSVGPVIIGFGVVYLMDHDILLDRNVTLMIKDTLVARFNTLVSMTYRRDHKFSAEDVELLKKIYRLGDEYLQKEGNLAYDGLALLEPICVDQMCRLARLDKVKDPTVSHMVPEDKRFQHHITEALGKISNPPWMLKIRNAVLNSPRIHTVLNIFGCYRHFGHPFLDHLQGVHELCNRVQDKRVVKAEYAERVGSYFVQRMASKLLLSQKAWVVDVDLLEERFPNCPILKDLKDMKWPGQRALEEFGDNWHLLPLKKCFDLPDMFDQSAIYSDKSHCPDLDEIIHHISTKPGQHIPTKRVLETLLSRPCTNWKEFLQQVNDKGLERNELVIAIRGKERELKRMGRFFALMSWRLREYFVVTEYLIKTIFLPYFEGITMADSLTKLTKKQINTTIGHGGEGYDILTYANHVDYSKWNNYQSAEANYHVFSAMGQMIGLPNLFTRTHEFFEKANVFYLGKPELLTVNTTPEGFRYVGCKGSKKIAWLGQFGGLEGLRQKGWSLTNVLVIMMEAERTTTATVKILAQGDNQVICVTFSVKSGTKSGADPEDIAEIDRLNRDFMDRVERKTEDLGLKVNQDERLVSTDFMIYGKVPIFKGNIYPVESKRWSRVTCVTNDQLPSVANVMSTVSSCAMTVAQYSSVPISSMILADFLGNLARNLTELHSPALMESFSQAKCLPKTVTERNKYMAALLYLEPSVGGPCGTALTRYLIRGFPDPVSESLTFWRAVYCGTTVQWIKDLALHAGNPRLKTPDSKSLSKLIENPVALNIRGGINPANILKEAVTRVLKGREIRNEVIKRALEIHDLEKENFYSYLDKMTPKFPRFMSALADGSILGVTEAIISQVANSRTIRNITKQSMWSSLDAQIHMAELMTIRAAATIPQLKVSIWDCSATKADQLRKDSWGAEIVGATVPHPMEMVGEGTQSIKGHCFDCKRKMDYLTLVIPKGLSQADSRRGDLEAYLGSSTSSSTSLSADYETITKLPMVRRALSLYECFHWFVDPASPLGATVRGVLKSLTGEDVPPPPLSLRTGTALHRFASDRQSSGGFSAQSPAPLTWMLVSSDTMIDLDKNYDFMYQGLFCYAQITATTKYWRSKDEVTIHFHVKCHKCIREIDDNIQLQAENEYAFRDYSSVLEKLKPADVSWITVKVPPELVECDWASKSVYEMSYHIGRTVGFLYGEKSASKAEINGGQLFPLVLRYKMHPYPYLDGILDGILRSAAVNSLYRSTRHSRALTQELTRSITDAHVYRLSREQDFCAFVSGTRIEDEMLSAGAPISPSYPAKVVDVGRSVYAYFSSKLGSDTKLDEYRPLYASLIIFPELNSPPLMAGIALGGRLLIHLTKNVGEMETCKRILTTYFSICEGTIEVPLSLVAGCTRVTSEVRHAVSDQTCDFDLRDAKALQDWGQECVTDHFRIPVKRVSHPKQKLPPPMAQRQCPLISGLREFMFATGSHYKVRSILAKANPVDVAVVGGDGSGGISSWVLRSGVSKRVIFNTLLSYDGVSLRGSLPGPPTAIKALGDMTNRCINYDTVWQEPSDLRQLSTWENFSALASPFGTIGLLILDMESTSERDFQEIYRLMDAFCVKHKIPEVLVKCYLTLLGKNPSLIKGLASRYINLDFTWSEMSSSHTSEVYIHASQFSSTCIPCSVDWDALWVDLGGHPIFSSEEQELDRALGLKRYNQMQGIPPELIPNVYVEFKSFLSWLGVTTSTSLFLGDKVFEHAQAPAVTHAWVVLGYIMNEMIWVKAPTRGQSTPPTESTVARIIALNLGTLFWDAWATGNVMSYKRAQTLNEAKVKFSFSSTLVGNAWQSYWEFSHKYQIKKSWTMESMQGLIGTWIRLLTRLFRNNLRERSDDWIRVKSCIEYLSRQGDIRQAQFFARSYKAWASGHVSYLDQVGRVD